ncbi:MAG: phytoene desaturase family protein [Hyphomicrobiaceae bacterium]|nr:phytoene desaturase family protein [Hyphomicrobiaceae bacterium]
MPATDPSATTARHGEAQPHTGLPSVGRSQGGDRVVVVGAGIGGLSAALELSHAGFDVLVVDQADQPGGKIRQLDVEGLAVDAGPTVLTMRWVFDDLLATVGARLEDEVSLSPLSIIARHAWSESERLDLHADKTATIDAIGAFAGPAEARAYEAFARTAQRLEASLRPTFMAADRPSMMGLAARMAAVDPGSLFLINPQASLWQTLKGYFSDPRLLQLFGRYATYCGASPYSAPATLMLIAHVETQGVYALSGGMTALPAALARLAAARGAAFRMASTVTAITTTAGRVSGVRLADGEAIAADAVVFNGDEQALATGLLGPEASVGLTALSPRLRSLSALAVCLAERFDGFPLVRHNVFFSSNYTAEFNDIARLRRLPREPTVYLCAQDRGGTDLAPAPNAHERALILVNAPAVGDTTPLPHEEIDRCWQATRALLNRCGLRIDGHGSARRMTSPADFHRLFPATGGALYGRASHGSLSAFQRPGSRSSLPGLYLAGGSVHPGPGVPMAALSGRQAAASLVQDRASIRTFRPAATSGGTSTR